MSEFILTIAIPTFERPQYLEILLNQLNSQLPLLKNPQSCEILVCDNSFCSETSDLVKKFIFGGLSVRYERNGKNIGSDLNIAKCFNQARGKYVWIIGDDDVIVDDFLSNLLHKLEQRDYGMVFVNAFGYDYDFRAELPSPRSNWKIGLTGDDFLLRAGAQITLISACVINRSIIQALDADRFVGGNLVQVHLVLSALQVLPQSLIYGGYGVACKRNNSGGYKYADVFVDNLGGILDDFSQRGRLRMSIHKFERRLLLLHHPIAIYKNLSNNKSERDYFFKSLNERYKEYIEYKLFILPIFYLPNRIARIWCFFLILFARIFLGGDFERGAKFLSYRFLRFFTIKSGHLL